MATKRKAVAKRKGRWALPRETSPVSVVAKKGPSPRSDDAVPTDFIRLADAFGRVLEFAKQKPQVLETIPEWAHDNLWCTIQALEEEEGSVNPKFRTSEMEIKAACLFRIALYEELGTYVRDPDHDKILSLNSEGWFFCDERVPTVFENWLSNDETPGPGGSVIRGKRRPVILRRQELETWLAETFVARTKPPKKRAGSYQKADAPIVEKMREAIDTGQAKSASAAATMFWPAPGSEDTELGVLMGPEVRHGEAEVYARVQA